MMPTLLLQRADNKTKIKNSHPQTSPTRGTSHGQQTLGPGKDPDTVPGTRGLRAAAQTHREAPGSSGHVGTSNLQTLLVLHSCCSGQTLLYL